MRESAKVLVRSVRLSLTDISQISDKDWLQYLFPVRQILISTALRYENAEPINLQGYIAVQIHTHSS